MPLSTSLLDKLRRAALWKYKNITQLLLQFVLRVVYTEPSYDDDNKVSMRSEFSTNPSQPGLQYCGDLGKTSKWCEQGKVCFPILLRLAKWRCPGGKQWKQTDVVLQAASQAPFNLLFNYFQSRKISVSFTKISYVLYLDIRMI